MTIEGKGLRSSAELTGLEVVDGGVFFGEELGSLAVLDGLEVVDGGRVFVEDFGSLVVLDFLGVVDGGRVLVGVEGLRREELVRWVRGFRASKSTSISARTGVVQRMLKKVKLIAILRWHHN